MGKKQGARAEAESRWRDRLARWRKSGLSVAEFCGREGVHPVSLYSWRKRLAGKRQRPAHQPRTSSAFVPVELVIDGVAPGRPLSACPCEPVSECELIAGSLICRVPRGLDEASLRRLIGLLREDP